MRLEEIYTKYDNIIRSENALPYIKCNDCNHIFFYIRHFCPKCGSKKLEVLKSSGIGKVFSWTKVYRKGESFVYGIVEVEEGFRVYCNFSEDVEIGDKVKVKTFVNGKYYKIIASRFR
ncbi:MAG: Zn-ribbon domain-containing OB-fold protein [Sulfolobaceae archaeon]